MTGATVVIDERFNGPPTSANGGYACGALARYLEPGAVEVTLRLPPPLSRPLRVEHDGERARMLDGDALVAEARRAHLDGAVPELPSLEVARASELPADHVRPLHPFPTCFACGPDRDPADAPRLLLGPVADRDGVAAAAWRPPASLPLGDDGALDAEIVWAALDCPTAAAAVPWGSPPHVLGRLAGVRERPVLPGRDHVVIAWREGHEGRKRYGAAAIFDADGQLCARSSAVWIALRQG